ncbi:MAG: methylated-DNA--[protein]-cysteine S-methyltransferase [Alistipes sp.]|jgi:methylated-DNA-[protein]-cysteine S-methyltransferase|nr:methylated-DNA--[protein]-cysteine S-methyltransferase [Alistipes sp.]
MDTAIIIKHYASPAGPLLLGSLQGRLCLCDWVAGGRAESTLLRLGRKLGGRSLDGTTDVIELAARQLDEYFARTRRTFDIPIYMAGSSTGTDTASDTAFGTGFQQKVWRALTEIPYGTTISYGELARSLGMPTAARAVAGAVGANPVSVVVPCHRVVGSNGSLTGFAGGLEAKTVLLEIERPPENTLLEIERNPKNLNSPAL